MQTTVGGPVNYLLPTAQKTWLHVGWENILQKWYDGLCEMKRKDRAKKMEQEHQKNVSQMIKSAHDIAGLLHKIAKPTA